MIRSGSDEDIGPTTEENAAAAVVVDAIVIKRIEDNSGTGEAQLVMPPAALEQGAKEIEELPSGEQASAETPSPGKSFCSNSSSMLYNPVPVLQCKLAVSEL